MAGGANMVTELVKAGDGGEYGEIKKSMELREVSQNSKARKYCTPLTPRNPNYGLFTQNWFELFFLIDFD